MMLVPIGGLTKMKRPKWRMVDMDTNLMIRREQIIKDPVGANVVVLSFTPPIKGQKPAIMVRPLTSKKPVEYRPDQLGIKLTFSEKEPTFRLRLKKQKPKIKRLKYEPPRREQAPAPAPAPIASPAKEKPIVGSHSSKLPINGYDVSIRQYVNAPLVDMRLAGVGRKKLGRILAILREKNDEMDDVEH